MGIVIVSLLLVVVLGFGLSLTILDYCVDLRCLPRFAKPRAALRLVPTAPRRFVPANDNRRRASWHRFS